MNLMHKVYRCVHDLSARPEERGEYSSGRWQDQVRTQVRQWVNLDQGRVLEVGCGEALFLSRLAKDHPGLDLHGVDVWDKILERARQRVHENGLSQVQLTLSDAARLPFPDGHFDLVVCVNVIFNLPSRQKFDQCLSEMARVCRTPGRIMLDIRNQRNPILYWKYKLAKYYDETVKDLPLMTYRLDEVSGLVEAKGLRVGRVCPIGFPKNRWAPILVLEAVKEQTR